MEMFPQLLRNFDQRASQATKQSVNTGSDSQRLVTNTIRTSFAHQWMNMNERSFRPGAHTYIG